LASYVPFLYLYFRSLWRFHPHYEFFPLVLVASVLLFCGRWPSNEKRTSVLTAWLARLLLFGGFVLLFAAVLFVFPWFAAVGAVLAVGGLTFALAGSYAYSNLLGPWLLLWLVIHPPKEFDTRLVHWLQSTAAYWSSQLLDMAHVYHVLTGAVIKLPDRELFVAEACSGIHSQLALIACAAVFVVFKRRTWLHGALLLLSAVFWAGLANVARIFSVTLAWSNFALDLWRGGFTSYSDTCSSPPARCWCFPQTSCC